MKTTKFLIVAVLTLLGVAASANEKVIELPPAVFSNNRAVEISRVTLSDTATVLDIAAFYRPGWWIKIASDSYLLADGKKYMIRSGQGIDLDSLFWMPQSGEASFKLVFEPLPVNTSAFDFIESDCDNCFKIYGVDLKNKRLKLSDIPDEYARDYLPENDLELKLVKGEAVVSGMLWGYRPEFGDVKLVYGNPITCEEDEVPVNVDADGSFRASIAVCSPTNLYLRLGSASFPVKAAPGKTSKLLVNLPEYTRKYSRLHKAEEPYGKEVYYAGYLAKLNTDLQHEALTDLSTADVFAVAADMDAHELKTFLMERYEQLLATSASAGISLLAQQVFNIRQAFLLTDILMNADSYILSSYAQKYKVPYAEAAQKMRHSSQTDDYNDFYRVLPYDDPTVLLVSDISFYIRSLGYARGDSNDPTIIMRYLAGCEEVSTDEKALIHAYIDAYEKGVKFEKTDSINSLYKKYQPLVEEYNRGNVGVEYLKKVLNTEDAFLFDLIRSQQISFALRDYNPLTDEQKQELESYPEIIRTTLLKENEELLAKIEENKKKTGYTVLEVPQVSNEQLFDEMVKPFRGKVVLVDFWATWCGPCRQANKAMEPLKAQLAGKDLAYVYMTGYTSPENTWRNMIPDLKGNHYRMDDAQWEYIRQQKKAEGVPTYLILDREGNQRFYSLGFPGADIMKRELLKALDQ
ncbi:TlpA family protein disulfide reductase [Anaerorudis cellulosivorans]|uniref:TlpA family protein disulfide reductase n=1 Tax=Anaerorudis cellulosivorans TaxID=3397862 RepID=UPI002221046C|nr:TlpA disulfide reductase family protein [Seramator thermalis]MCW1734084.1 TlpA family protein disulfide reductase [Seramator thermalis]